MLPEGSKVTGATTLLELENNGIFAMSSPAFRLCPKIFKCVYTHTHTPLGVSKEIILSLLGSQIVVLSKYEGRALA